MKRKAKKIFAIIMCLVFILPLVGCNSGKEVSANNTETKVFTDSLGREVELPKEIQYIAVTGPMAQIPLFALSPDKLVGIANPWNENATEYIDKKYLDLPQLGQLYGGKGEMNLETLLGTKAQVVIDVGEAKEGAKEDLDNLQEQTGIPFVHVDASLKTMGDAFIMLGDLLGMEKEAKEYAEYCDNIYNKTSEIANGVDKKKVLYITGEEGHNVIAKSSFHAELIDMLADNLAVVDEPSSRGTGNEVDMEQILLWNPDYIIFSPDSVYETVAEDDNWKNMTAIKNENYYEVPDGPYNWVGSPPSAQRVLGMVWLAQTLYPEERVFDLKAETKKFYHMFYHCDLTDEQYNELVK
ncbi:MAG: ABC transporter substrate-binding protein [Lagierella massiliensis]|nr:ABC transporter substrate-binding protein [Lagierella massiliensis]